MIDYEKLDAVLNHIETHPEQHNQSSWGVKTECGTTACFAGWTLLMFGKPEDILWLDNFALSTPHDSYDDVDDIAGDILGLEEDQRPALFYTAKTLEDVKVIVKELHNDPNANFNTLRDAIL